MLPKQCLSILVKTHLYQQLIKKCILKSLVFTKGGDVATLVS